MFPNTQGRRIGPNRLGSQVHPIIKAAGIGKKGSCHPLRHTFATLPLESGCGLRRVREMLWRSKLKTSAVDTRVSIRTLKEMHAKYHPAKLPNETPLPTPPADVSERMPATAYRYLVKTPGVCQGRTIVEGTRIGVHDVMGLSVNGATIEEVLRSFPDLTPAQIYECMAYYEDHRTEIDALIAEQMSQGLQ